MLLETKDGLRNIFREKRSALTQKQRHLLDREIVRNFYANISVAPSSVIAGYMPIGSEADISLLLEMYTDDGHTICLPCVDEKNEPMAFRKYAFGAPLVKNKLTKTMEPPAHFEEVEPDIIITPLVAFDAAGTRLGQGGGYYDRTFEHLRNMSAGFLAVGVGYSAQQAQFIRRDEHDFKLDAVVTEKKVLTF